VKSLHTVITDAKW